MGAGVGASAQGSGITSVAFVTGIWTDELVHVQGSFSGGTVWLRLDERVDNDITRGSFFSFNRSWTNIRTSAQLAREALETYAPASPPAWRSRMQIQEAFGIIYAAEIFCSGYPLTRVHLAASPTLTRGFTTDEMLTRAVALFDSAIVLAGDSTRFTYLAMTGKGRALLDQGKFAAASAAVSQVPTDFVYNLEFNGTISLGANSIGNSPQSMQVRDNEGGTGLQWSADPRTGIVTTPSLTGSMLVPGKYSVVAGVINAAVANPNASIRAADGLEARLIEAEAALAGGDPSWLTKLNALRSTCIGATACAPVPGLTVTNLPANLTDPGTADARLDLLMKERAMWLYLTGHRQGDLRRLAHFYHRDPVTLWPSGTYVNPGFPPLVAASVDNGLTNYQPRYVWDPAADDPSSSELALNPLYAGCVDLNP